jgi:serine/threonine protein kinase
MFETLGHYRILDRIGGGGIGDVYRARDTKFGRTTAIKVMSRDIAANPERRRQLVADARAAIQLSHPNIAALYEIGEDQDTLYLVFEFVPGEPLARVIAGRPLHPKRSVDLTAQVADALAEAHAHSIVHRAISSETIIITPKEKAKVLDFGLAAWTRTGAVRARAEAATSAGTPPAALAYLSPEQARGDEVDYRTDIFSTGVVLFEMLTGRVPWTATTADDYLREIIGSQAPAPSTISATAPRELDGIVAKALAKTPDERYDSAAGFAAELRQITELLDARAERRSSNGAGWAGGAGGAGRADRLDARQGRELLTRWIVVGAAVAALVVTGWCIAAR